MKQIVTLGICFCSYCKYGCSLKREIDKFQIPALGRRLDGGRRLVLRKVPFCVVKDDFSSGKRAQNGVQKVPFGLLAREHRWTEWCGMAVKKAVNGCR